MEDPSTETEKQETAGELLLIAFGILVLVGINLGITFVVDSVLAMQAFGVVATLVGAAECIVLIRAAIIRYRGFEGDLPWEDIFPAKLILPLACMAVAIVFVGFPVNAAWNGFMTLQPRYGDAAVYFFGLLPLLALVYGGHWIFRLLLLPVGLSDKAPQNATFRHGAYLLVIISTLSLNIMKFMKKTPDADAMRLPSIAFEVMVTFIAIDTYVNEFMLKRRGKAGHSIDS